MSHSLLALFCRQLPKALVAGIAALTGAGMAQAAALDRISITSVADYKSVPTTSVQSAPPLVMLAMSNDEQLYVKAYTDYTDLNNDGKVDVSYQNAFSYSGYFDSGLCYEYSVLDGRFRATAAATASTADTTAVPPVSPHRCGSSSSRWSGNFLNWLSMTRLDVVRSVLYGGLRQTDTTTLTVLERTYLPTDVHAWSKVYSGSDVADFTPYGFVSGSPVSFCNVSRNALSTESATDDAVPLLRVARGNFSEWATTELAQCLWRDTEGPNVPADTPNTTSIGSVPFEFTVRTEVCQSGASAVRENFCREYVSGAVTTFKPAGLVQRYGESGALRFGLMTGSYSKPRSGGQLRRNISRVANNNENAVLTCETGDEIDLTTGQFCSQTVATAGGTLSPGIISTLNRFRITHWNTSTNKHTDCNTPGITNRQNSGGGGNALRNPGNPSSGTAYDCNSWGNPLSEIYAEALRYFATPSAGATAQFTGTEPSLKSHAGSTAGVLPAVPWADPLTAQTYCADCSIVLISTGLNSFDTDEIPAIAALGATADAATDAVGVNEGLSGQVLAGRMGSTPVGTSLNTHTDVCEARNFTSLSAVRGICPEVPSYEGGYQIAGLAHKGHTQDLRDDLQSKQSVRTYAIALAESLPSFTIPVGSGAITIAPSCQSNPTGGAALGDTGWASCALANVTLGTKKASVAPMRTYGRALELDASAGSLFLSWEDSPWGNDRDLDVTTMITYCVGAQCNYDSPDDTDTTPDICFRSDSTATCNADGTLAASVGPNEVLIRTEILSANAGFALSGGFVVGGAAANNGFQRLVLRPGSQNASLLTGTDANPPGNWSKPKVLRFTAGSSPVTTLPNPLLYAAKYGGFKDIAVNGVLDGLPTRAPSLEWDEINNFTGAATPDGLPDNYFPVRNPAQLQARLADVFNDILRRASSGTAAAVVASAREGEGAIYQALFEPGRIAGNQEVNWIGTLHSLWLDGNGQLREDGGIRGTLEETNYVADPAIQIYFDETDRITKFRRFNGNPADPATTSVDGLSIDSLRTLWNARKQLSSLTDASLVSNRAYTDSAASGRYIFTFLDYNKDGKPDTNEIQPFVPGTFVSGSSNGNYGILNVRSTADAAKVVNFIRGREPATTAGLRSRQMDYDGDPSTPEEVLRLGDIVQSTPTVVGTPAEAIDLLYSDQTYAQFRERYRTRRNVVYVGANDGLLHAFNGGFFNAQSKSFGVTAPGSTPDAARDHPLGSELWAYAPYNLLPHLTWLTDVDYPHVWYVDGKPRAFDARIFPSDAAHPNGWGTVLVVGMRLGGSKLELKRPTAAASDGSTMSTNAFRSALSRFGVTSAATEVITTRSAYIVLDVTNPEEPPTLIAEISDPALGLTTSFPTAMSVARTGNAPSPGVDNRTVDDWYLVFGSGPANGPATATPPGTAAGLYVWDLKTKAPVTGWFPKQIATAPASFVGDPVSVDWDLDFKADAVYFGTIGGSAAMPTGQLYKVNIQAAGDRSVATNEARPATGWVVSTLVNAGAPVVATPSVTFDEQGTRWVLSGTGRFFANEDKPTSTPQYLFGVIDRHLSDLPAPPATTPVTVTTRANYFDVTNAKVLPTGQVTGVVASVTNETQLISAVDAAGGWQLKLNDPTSPSERNVTGTSLLGDILFATGFTPSNDLCLGEGVSRLFGLYYKTGAPKSDLPVFGTRVDTVTGFRESIRDIPLGPGLAAAPSLALGSNRDNRGITIFAQTSTGAIERREGDIKDDARSGETDWRERYE